MLATNLESGQTVGAKGKRSTSMYLALTASPAARRTRQAVYAPGAFIFQPMQVRSGRCRELRGRAVLTDPTHVIDLTLGRQRTSEFRGK